MSDYAALKAMTDAALSRRFAQSEPMPQQRLIDAMALAVHRAGVHIAAAGTGVGLRLRAAAGGGAVCRVRCGRAGGLRGRNAAHLFPYP